VEQMPGPPVPPAGLQRLGRDNPSLLRALLNSSKLFGLALGTELGRLRESENTFSSLYARIKELELCLHLAHKSHRILAARWEKIPERHRPHYTPELRFEILEVKHAENLSQRETAVRFQLCRNTIDRWEQEAFVNPDSQTVGSLLKPIPSIRRIADVVRRLVQFMKAAAFEGSDTIARFLARAGLKISARSIGRIVKERGPRPPLFRSAGAEAAKTRRFLKARYPNHMWMADLTEIPGLFRLLFLKLAVVYDAFSRMPLAASLFPGEPSAAAIARLFSRAPRRFGRARHVVSDQGSQFTAAVFRETLIGLAVRHRFGAIGKTGSIALIERFWRTIKQKLALKTLKPLVMADLRRRLDLGLLHYSYHRPHQALGGATPAEIYFARTPAHLAAVPAPRGRPGQDTEEQPIAIVFLDPERRLPILVRKVA
jgi:putative transposase